MTRDAAASMTVGGVHWLQRTQTVSFRVVSKCQLLINNCLFCRVVEAKYRASRPPRCPCTFGTYDNGCGCIHDRWSRALVTTHTDSRFLSQSCRRINSVLTAY